MSYNNYDNYSSTAYGGGGGGGFIPGEGSQTTPSNRRDYSQEHLRPVTIKQIVDAQPLGDDFKVDGAPLTQLTLVGQIRNVSTQATNITYKLDDGTGSIEVKEYVNTDLLDDPSGHQSKLVQNAYCRVFGNLKSFHDRRHVNAKIIRPVEDYNEVNYHLLEATLVHLHYTRGPLDKLGEAGQQAGGHAAGQHDTVMGGAAYGGQDLAAYSGTARKVFKYLSETEQTNEGLHQQEIAANLGLDIAEVARAGDDLLAGGLIYTTVDDQTWAVLEAD